MYSETERSKRSKQILSGIKDTPEYRALDFLSPGTADNHAEHFLALANAVRQQATGVNDWRAKFVKGYSPTGISAIDETISKLDTGGADAVAFRKVNSQDVVVGITASGRTPFVLGALAEARRRGAINILLCFNPRLRLPASQRPSLVIAPRIGPEVLTGSTRLKAA